MSPFVHLHVHSHYSLLDGLGTVEQYVEKAKALGMTAVALTDKGNVHGLIDLYKACGKAGMKAILGCEMFVAIRSRFDQEAGIDNQRHHLLLIAKDRTGYENLLKLSSEAYLTGMYYKPRIDMDLLRENAEGLIAIIPRVNGEISRHLLNENKEEAEKALKKYGAIFGEDLYLEMLHRPKFEDDALLEKSIVELSKKTGVPLVATNDVSYVLPEDADAHDTLLCLQYNTLKNDPHRFHLLDHDLSFVSGETMEEWFSSFPEAVANSKKIADLCDVNFEFGKYRIPSFQIPEGFASEKEYLRHLCEEGICTRYGYHQKDEKSPAKDSVSDEMKRIISERLDYELDVIGNMGFESYFLIVWDFVRWAKKSGIAVGPGRGSAAGAIVAYLLDITDLDPIKYNLLFERFLNPERISMPDIDLDFADDRRDEVIDYVRGKYGTDRVAQICTFGTMAARAAVKDVGRVMGLPFAEMNEFGKLIPDRPGTTLAEAEKKSPELMEALQNDEVKRKIYMDAKKLEGNVRHISVHACAVVIAPEPILKYSAIQHPPKDDQSIITQYSAKPLDSLGLLKMDFLGLRNLTILERAKSLVRGTKGVVVDFSTIPMDDKKTFELLSSARTTGVFQLESAGMKRYLKELKPTDFEDIIAMVSLFRPGPMQFIPDYIKGKHGKKYVSYLHKSLEEILQPTFGIAIYQEQILKMAQIFAGFSLGQADILRRAIGKKIPEELAAQRQRFLDGSKNLGHSEKLATKIFDEIIEPFAGYGFNRSHAACYAQIAYETAYIKAHYPTEFFAALLSADQGNTDRVILDIGDARVFDITVLPPDINESSADFAVTKSKVIRFGLIAVKGVGTSVVEEILKARKEEKFATFSDFLSRVSPKALNKKSLEVLAKSGAFSGFLDARAILDNLDEVLKYVRTESHERDDSQSSLFGGKTFEKHELSFPDTKSSKLSERLRWEKEVLGIYVSSHPLRGMSAYFLKKGVPIRNIPDALRFGKSTIQVNGLSTSVRKIITKKNEVMAIVMVEDLTGTIEAVFFPKAYSEFQSGIQEDAFLSLRGKAEKRNGVWQIVVDKLTSKDLEETRKEAEDEGLLNEDEAFYFTSEGDSSSVSPDEERDPGDEIHGISDIEESPESNGRTIFPHPAVETPFRIELPDGFSREKMKLLHSLLSDHPGEKDVEIVYQNHSLLFPSQITLSKELMDKISALLGE